MGLNFASLLGGNLGSLVKDVVGSFKLSPEKKAELEAMIENNEQAIRLKEFELEKKAMEATQTLVDAQKAIIVAEMGQSDDYTKRARPTLVYAGLAFIAMNYVIMPMIAFFFKRAMPELALPAEFWVAWTSVVGIWSLGRSFERRGAQNKLIRGITGTGGGK